ncbi:MAG: hypothetical protein ABIV50_10505, partial [Opitutus sp.]
GLVGDGTKLIGFTPVNAGGSGTHYATASVRPACGKKQGAGQAFRPWWAPCRVSRGTDRQASWW